VGLQVFQVGLATLNVHLNLEDARFQLTVDSIGPLRDAVSDILMEEGENVDLLTRLAGCSELDPHDIPELRGDAHDLIAEAPANQRAWRKHMALVCARVLPVLAPKRHGCRNRLLFGSPTNTPL
jgi:hypothetical protein